ncbi:hypothetical protein NERG_02200 [Nematocida ausubeli]|uniref:Uncharacterized protein n=1 Tax=Nematocida ausubeli (strain ATCC PRA-371 / ERTm2) TaxID=1913371 RepID=H8ZF31_NEMA1|nr:hypothetical protein NERG_02200 [Nematocida ausubeli]
MREFTVPRVFVPIPPIKSSLHITHRVIDLDPRERTYPTNSNYFSTITRLCRFMSQAILAWGINKVTASQGSALFPACILVKWRSYYEIRAILVNPAGYSTSRNYKTTKCTAGQRGAPYYNHRPIEDISK